LNEPKILKAEQPSTPPMRKCRLCQKTQPEVDYYRVNGKLMSRCKECHKGYIKFWRKHHKGKVAEFRKQYGQKKRRVKIEAYN
jgi:hypothetical protein